MRVVFMGTPFFALPTLQALLSEHEVAAVITQPDKPKGRGKKIQFSPVKELAIAHNLPVLQPIKIREPEFAAQLAAFEADVFVVVAYGQILPETLINMPKYGCLNVHGSLLPAYRGPAPIHHAVINGEEKTGVTIMFMDKGLDTGDMLLKKELPILPEDNMGTLHDKMAVHGADALIETLKRIENNTFSREKQDDAQSTYACMVTKEMGHIEWCKKSADIVNLIRGLNPWPCAYTLLDGQPMKIWAAEATDHNKAGKHGEIIDIASGGLVVKTGDTSVLVREIQAHGGKRMAVSDYLRGHKMEMGMMFD